MLEGQYVDASANCVRISHDCAEECVSNVAMDMEHCRICAEACDQLRGGMHPNVGPGLISSGQGLPEFSCPTRGDAVAPFAE